MLVGGGSEVRHVKATRLLRRRGVEVKGRRGLNDKDVALVIARNQDAHAGSLVQCEKTLDDIDETEAQDTFAGKQERRQSPFKHDTWDRPCVRLYLLHRQGSLTEMMSRSPTGSAQTWHPSDPCV